MNQNKTNQPGPTQHQHKDDADAGNRSIEDSAVTESVDTAEKLLKVLYVKSFIKSLPPLTSRSSCEDD